MAMLRAAPCETSVAWAPNLSSLHETSGLAPGSLPPTPLFHVPGCSGGEGPTPDLAAAFGSVTRGPRRSPLGRSVVTALEAELEQVVIG